MKKWTRVLAIGLLALAFSCDKNPGVEVTPDTEELAISPEVALKWSNLTLKVMVGSPNNSPTYGSRSLGYIGLTMYESAVPGSIEFKSIASQLNGLPEVPKPVRADLDWELTVNGGQREIILSLYPQITGALKTTVDSLHDAIAQARMTAGVSTEVAQASEDYGKQVAQHIYEWSKSDGGHNGYLNTFSATYELPQGVQYWIPPKFGQSTIELPMHPHWGENRNFLKANTELPVPEIIEFSRDKESPYYAQMLAVYEKQLTLTQTEKEAALWWGDDPASSPSPPGHSYYLASTLVDQDQTNLFEATSVFARVGMSVADAFINTFKCKYFYHAERPTQYINRNIHGTYWQFWPEPPFPSFTSGHSTQAAAAAASLISVYGDDTPVKDEFHKGRPRDEGRGVDFKPRSFNTIWAFAEECGWSRILGGIHTPQDNEKGLEEGKKIGENFGNLSWKN